MNKCCFLLLFVVLLILSSCEKKRYYEGDLRGLTFSTDTVHFDTVFTTIGTTTREFRVRNTTGSWMMIEDIILAGGNDSPFRVNVDGLPGNTFSDIELTPGDSIFIFVDVIIDPNDQDNPVLLTDSLEFRMNGQSKAVRFIAWGQDIFLVNSERIGTETWSGGKPYVIYNSMIVDTGHVLTVNEGTRLLFHRGSTMYIAGSLVVNGSTEKPVIFASDRTEEMYYDVPGQWQGLYFLNGGDESMITNAEIRNAVSGIHAGNLGTSDPAPVIMLSNLRIEHMSVSGISSIGASFFAENVIISHCGYYCAFLSAGGEYSFIHCTMANQWDYSNRISPSLYISDFYDYDETRYAGELVSAGFYNTVITGNRLPEVYMESSDGELMNVEFINCLIGNTDLQDYSSEDCIFNENPLFLDWGRYDFRPDTLSPLINTGSLDYAGVNGYDIRGFSRLADEGPDIGAYERQPGEYADYK